MEGTTSNFAYSETGNFFVRIDSDRAVRVSQDFASRFKGRFPSGATTEECASLAVMKLWVETEFVSDAGQDWYRLLFDETPVSAAADPILLGAKTVGDARLVALQVLLRSVYSVLNEELDDFTFDGFVDESSAANEGEPEMEKEVSCEEQDGTVMTFTQKGRELVAQKELEEKASLARKGGELVGSGIQSKMDGAPTNQENEEEEECPTLVRVALPGADNGNEESKDGQGEQDSVVHGNAPPPVGDASPNPTTFEEEEELPSEVLVNPAVNGGGVLSVDASQQYPLAVVSEEEEEEELPSREESAGGEIGVTDISTAPEAIVSEVVDVPEVIPGAAKEEEDRKKGDVGEGKKNEGNPLGGGKEDTV